MVFIKIKKGLDIPIIGGPTGSPQELPKPPNHIALDLSLFEDLKFKILVRLDDHVKIGQPLIEDKDCPGRFFVSPAGGVVREIRRGLKRRLLAIVIDVAKEEEIERLAPATPAEITRLQLIERLKTGGLFTHIRQRPFNFLANPAKVPRSIFVKAIESVPFVPPPELQVEGFEKEFQAGLDALRKLTEGQVHLVFREGSSFHPFLEAQGVQKHTAAGPHPIANSSVHIERIDPILSPEDVVWTLDARAVVAIGVHLLKGIYFVPRIISIAGPGIVEGRTGYFLAREGYPVSDLLEGRLKKGPVRLISGNPLTGHEVDSKDFLGYDDTVLCAIEENTRREFLHFFRPGSDKFTFSRAYLSGLLDHANKAYDFSTNQHGESRPFIDSSLSDEVMPLNVSTMHLVKAVLAEDFDLATSLGLLEVDSEDFALPSFVCPSKIEMADIIKQGLRRYASDVLK